MVRKSEQLYHYDGWHDDAPNQCPSHMKGYYHSCLIPGWQCGYCCPGKRRTTPQGPRGNFNFISVVVEFHRYTFNFCSVDLSHKHLNYYHHSSDKVNGWPFVPGSGRRSSTSDATTLTSWKAPQQPPAMNFPSSPLSLFFPCFETLASSPLFFPLLPLPKAELPERERYGGREGPCRLHAHKPSTRSLR